MRLLCGAGWMLFEWNSDWDRFVHNAKKFEDSHTYKVQFSRMGEADYLWNPIIQADYLDKEGTVLFEDLQTVPKLKSQNSGRNHPAASPNDPMIDLAYKVERLMAAYQRLYLAFVLYRQLLYATEAHWSPQSLEYCWVANRLGNVLEIFGLRTDALELYLKASAGRANILGQDHEKTKESRERAERLLRDIEPSAQDG